jgi:hypothetical protein
MMRNFITQILFFSVVVLGVESPVWAVKPCVVCMEEIHESAVAENKALQCPAGHTIDQGCLARQVKSHDDLRGLKADGLQCCGSSPAGAGLCGHKHPLAALIKVLSDQSPLRRRTDRSSGQTRSGGESSG